MNVEQNKVFEKDEQSTWQCAKCGYLYTGNKALERCPACAHSKAYFQVLAENW